MRAHIDLKRLHHVVLLSEELSFIRAAERAHLSQSAFTRSIQSLEDDIGLRLFDRGSRYVRVTAVGWRTVERARRLLAGAHDLISELAYLKTGDAGSVAIGIGPYSAKSLLSPILAEFHNRFPDVRTRVEISSCSILLEHLNADRIDFFISDARDIQPAPELVMRPLGRYFGTFFCSAQHPLLAQPSVTVRELAGYGLAAVTLPERSKEVMRRMLKLEAREALPIALEADDPELLMNIVQRTQLIIAAPYSAVQRGLDDGSIAELVLPELSASSELYSDLTLVSRCERSLPPATEALIAAILAASRSNRTDGWQAFVES